VYGLGSSQSLYYERSRKSQGTRASQSFEPSILSQIETRNKLLEEQIQREREERQREIEELRQECQREIEELRSMFLNSQSCNNFSAFRDPRDPGDGGGASGSFLVQPL